MIKLWDFNNESTTIHFVNKKSIYQSIYLKTNKVLLCYCSSRQLEVVDLGKGKIVLSAKFDNLLSSSSCLIYDEVKYFSTFHAPFLTYFQCEYDIKENHIEFSSSTLLKIKEENHMIDIVYFEETSYIVTLNEFGRIFVFIFKNDKLTLINKSIVNKEEENVKFLVLNQKKFFNNRFDEKIYSLVPLSKNLIGMEMENFTLTIRNLPDLEFVRSVKFPSGGKLFNILSAPHQDILFNFDNKKMNFNLIYPFYESKYGQNKSYCTYELNVIKNFRYLKVSNCRNSLMLYTNNKVYKVNLI